jgi:hypothetical protein
MENYSAEQSVRFGCSLPAAARTFRSALFVLHTVFCFTATSSSSILVIEWGNLALLILDQQNSWSSIWCESSKANGPLYAENDIVRLVNAARLELTKQVILVSSLLIPSFPGSDILHDTRIGQFSDGSPQTWYWTTTKGTGHAIESVLRHMERIKSVSEQSSSKGNYFSMIVFYYPF